MSEQTAATSIAVVMPFPQTVVVVVTAAAGAAFHFVFPAQAPCDEDVSRVLLLQIVCTQA